jgi:hypothetical protein
MKDDVGSLPDLQRAQLVVPADPPGGVDRHHLERLARWQHPPVLLLVPLDVERAPEILEEVEGGAVRSVAGDGNHGPGVQELGHRTRVVIVRVSAGAGAVRDARPGAGEDLDLGGRQPGAVGEHLAPGWTGINGRPGAWWVATFPGLAIFATVLGFNPFDGGLRDALDPALRSGA